MRLKKAICSALLLLTACTPPAEKQCPAVKYYSTQEQIQIATEREQLPPDSILRSVLNNWEEMRRELR